MKKQIKSLKKKLPKHPNILGRDRFFNSAVLIPLVEIEKEYYLLFQKRATNIRQGGDICFPGGGFEKKVDKNFKQTALRETYEELGIRKKDIKILGQMDTYLTPIGAVIESFVGLVKKKAYENMKLDFTEVEKTILIPLLYFKENSPIEYCLKHQILPYEIDENKRKVVYFPSEELNLPSRYQEPWGYKNHTVWVYKYEGEVIWGITSVLINELIKFLDN